MSSACQPSASWNAWPNPSTEITFQRPLGALWPVANVEDQGHKGGR